MTILRSCIASIHRTVGIAWLSVAMLDPCVLTIELPAGVERHADVARARPTTLSRRCVCAYRVAVDGIGRYGSIIADAVSMSNRDVS